MDHTLDWTALPVVVEVLGVTDVEALLARLMAIREHIERKRNV